MDTYRDPQTVYLTLVNANPLKGYHHNKGLLLRRVNMKYIPQQHLQRS